MRDAKLGGVLDIQREGPIYRVDKFRLRLPDKKLIQSIRSMCIESLKCVFLPLKSAIDSTERAITNLDDDYAVSHAAARTVRIRVDNALLIN